MDVIYCHEAKERVAGLGASVISELINRVPTGVRTKLFSNLAPIPGFRKGSQMLLKEQHKKFLHSVTHISDPRFRADGAEWHTLKRFWHHWAITAFGENFVGPEPMPGLQDKSSTLKYFSALIDACGVNGCAQEEVKFLYRLSGFPNSADVVSLIDKLPLREVIEQQRELARLPSEVQRAHGRLDNFEKIIEQLRDGVTGVTKSLTKSAQQSDDVKRLLALEDDVRQLGERLVLEVGNSSSAVGTLFSKLERSIQAIESGSSQVAEQLTKSNKEIVEAQIFLGKHLAGLEKSVEEHLVSVDEKVKELKFQCRTASDGLNVSSAANGQLRVNRVRAPIPSLSSIRDPVQALSHISSNLSSVGVQTLLADEIALVVLAAASCGQLIQLTGSLAEPLAIGICASLGGDEYIAWDVPLGLFDGAQAAAIVETMRSDTNKPGCLLIRGANKSAFEIYGDDVRHVIVSNQLEFDAEANIWPCVATWSEGPATLPGGALLASLGPVINSDNLTWGRAKPEKLRHAVLDTSALAAAMKSAIDGDVAMDLVEDFEKLFAPFNQMRRRIVLRALSALLGLTNSELFTSLKLATTYWGLPWAQALGMSRNEVEGRIRSVSSKLLDVTTLNKGLSELTNENLN